jgi:hypothetical protein
MNESASNVDERLSEDLAVLNNMTDEQTIEIVDLVLSFLIDPVHSNFQSGLSAFVETHQINAGQMRSCAQSLIIFLQEAMKGGYNMVQLEERCLTLNLATGVITIITKLWKKKSSSIATSLLARTLSNNQLIDLDWSFGVTAASDDCDHVGKTFLQIKLTVDRGAEGPKEIFMELSLEQFYSFLASMEKCRTYLDYVNPV